MRNYWTADPISYMYWLEKSEFLFNQDIYKEWTMIAVEEGRFQYEIGESKGEAGFGDLIICPPNVPFIRKVLSPLTFHFVKFIWENEPETNNAESLAGKVSVSDTARLISTYAYLRDIGSGSRDRLSAGRLRHFLNDIWQLVDLEKESFNSEAFNESGAEVDIEMLKARKWLTERAYQPISVRRLADQLSISPVQLTRRFRTAFGVTPTDYVTGLRLARACRLLKETSLSLEAIAQRCGYENGFYLSRVFSGKLGMRPSAYRKLHQI